MRKIDLPYRLHYGEDMVCCHPEIADEGGWRFAGAIINNDGSTPKWCPVHKVCDMK